MTLLKRISWTASNERQLVLPNGQGQMTFQSFPGGAMLMTSSMEVAEPTEIAFPHDDHGIHIAAQYFLSGSSTIVMGNGAEAEWAPDGASMIRTDTPGFRLRVEAGQVLRHVCVGMYRGAILPQLSRMPSSRLETLMALGDPVDLAVSVPPDLAVRQVAADLYRLHQVPGLGEIKAESLALGFFSEVLERYAALDPASPSRVETWQARAVRKIRAAIDRDPGHDFAPGEILERFRMGEHMARRVFQAEFGVSMAAHARTTRLAKARAALLGGATSVKQASFDSGYAHIGNFTRAYKQQFGENPSDTRARPAR